MSARTLPAWFTGRWGFATYAASAGLVFGLMIAPAPAPAPQSAPPPPLYIEDAQALMAKLRPLIGDMRWHNTDAAIYVWADGTVRVSVKLDGGSELRGRGNSLAAAVADMTRQSETVKAALVKPVTP